MKDKKLASPSLLASRTPKSGVQLALVGLFLCGCTATRGGDENASRPAKLDPVAAKGPPGASAKIVANAAKKPGSDEPEGKKQDTAAKHPVLGPMQTLPGHKGALSREDNLISYPLENRRVKKIREKIRKREMALERRRQRQYERAVRRARKGGRPSKGHHGIPGGVAGGVVGGVARGVAGGVRSSSSSGQLRVGAQVKRRPSTVQAGSTVEAPSERERVATAQTRFSTLATDVDTASYSRMRASLRENRVLHPDSVRVEEMINYFDYLIPSAQSDEVVRVRTEMGPAMWNNELSVLRVAVAAKPTKPKPPPKRNLVFLIDVSGSMARTGGLDLVQYGFEQLVETLDKNDRVGIVVYSGHSGEALPPTSGAKKDKILSAIYSLRAAGSTHGSEGIRLAYERARQNFIKGGVNRVILATDGDFNVGVSSVPGLIKLIEKERDSGVYLSVIGVLGGPNSDVVMEQLADHGNGNYAYLESHAEARRVLMHEVAETLNPVADDVKIQVEFDPKTVKSHRLIGYLNRRLSKEDFNDDKKDAGDIGDGQMSTALFEVELQPGKMDGHFADVSVRYRPVGATEHRAFKRSHFLRHNRLEDTSVDFRFSNAVTQFAQLMRSQAANLEDYADVYRVAEGARGEDFSCKRAEFVNLVRDYVIARDASGQSQAWAPVRCQIPDEVFVQKEETLDSQAREPSEKELKNGALREQLGMGTTVSSPKHPLDG